MKAITIHSSFLSVAISPFGASIVDLVSADRTGKKEDVVLRYGFDSDDLAHQPEPTFGTVIGRHANRIGNATFDLEGKTYPLAANNSKNNLHSGPIGFHNRMWDVIEATDNRVVLFVVSPDGDQGFPGTLKATVVYTVEGKQLRIDYQATTDKTTLCNLTNHAYFNLCGLKGADNQTPSVAPSALDHEVKINASYFIPIDETSIPLGNKQAVADTPFDFRTFHRLGERIDQSCEQLKAGTGYDHSFEFDAQPNATAVPDAFPTPSSYLPPLQAEVREPLSGRILRIYTTEPAAQLYTANFLSGFENLFKESYPARSGFCIETQHHPDSIHHPQFAQCVLRPGEVYRQTTIFELDAE